MSATIEAEEVGPQKVINILRNFTNRKVKYSTNTLPGYNPIEVKKGAFIEIMMKIKDRYNGEDKSPTFNVDVYDYTIYVRPNQRYVIS